MFVIAALLAVPAAAAGQYRNYTVNGARLFVQVVNPGLVANRCLLKFINSGTPGGYEIMMGRIRDTVGYCAFPWAPGYQVILPTTMSEAARDRALQRVGAMIADDALHAVAFFDRGR